MCECHAAVDLDEEEMEPGTGGALCPDGRCVRPSLVASRWNRLQAVCGGVVAVAVMGALGGSRRESVQRAKGPVADTIQGLRGHLPLFTHRRCTVISDA